MKEPKIFISNRVTDSYYYSQVLSDKLREHFGGERIFKFLNPSALQAIKLADPSEPQGIRETIQACDVLIALVGRHFLTDRNGHYQLAAKSDYQRVAIATALAYGLPVIPVLLPYCDMPRAEDLPEDIKEFASLRGIGVDILSWKENLDALCVIIKNLPPKRAPQTLSAMPLSAETLIERAKGIREARRLAGHTNFPAWLAFSPDSRLLASGSYDQTVRLWDVATGKLLWTREGHWPMALSVAFSPDGRTLACTGGVYGITLYDVETGETIRRITGHDNYVNCVAFSPDGRTLASGSNDMTVKLWDLDDHKGSSDIREPADTLTGHDGVVWSLSVSADGERLASAASDGAVRIWHLANRSATRVLSQRARTVAFSPDSRLLASNLTKSYPPPAIVSCALLLSEVETGRARREVTPTSELLAMAWTPDAAVIALRLEDSLQLLHAETGREIYTQRMAGGAGGRGYVRPLCVSPDGRFLATFAGGSSHHLQLWDISALGVGPQAQPEQQHAAVTIQITTPLRAHLRTLPLSHARPPTPARPAAWLRGAAAIGVRPPLCIVQDFGALLTQPRTGLRLERPSHLPEGVDTSAYLKLLERLAAHPLLREVSTWDVSDAVAGMVIARMVAGLSFPEMYSLPCGIEAVAFSQRMGVELSKADASCLWRETAVAERPKLTELLSSEAMARIEANLRRMDSDELRFLHRYGPRFAGTPDPREMLDLFNLLDLPPAARLALSQVLRLLPRVSQEVSKAGGMQTYAMGGYAGLTHRGNLDSLVPTELAYPSQMLLHRLLNQEALYYGRESEQERQREVTYIVTQAGVEVRGDMDVLARAVTLALVQAMQGRGHEVQQSFVGSRWTEPSLMSRPSDVQRVLYYRDEGGLRARDMLASVLGQLRAWRERYRGLHLIWVVGEHWDADEWEENRDLYTSLRLSANAQAWFIRLGGNGVKARAAEPFAARAFGHYQVVNSEIMWAKREPPDMKYVPPVEAPPEIITEEPWVEPIAPPSRVMLIQRSGSYGTELRDFITSELHARGHMVMIDRVLSRHSSWMAALRGVDLVMPLLALGAADNSGVRVAINAVDTLGRRGSGPRLLPVLVTNTILTPDRYYEETLLRSSLKGVLDVSKSLTWRGAEDNQTLLRAMLEALAPALALAPAPAPLRLEGMYVSEVECVDWSHPEKDWSWMAHHLRFNPDGTVLHHHTWPIDTSRDYPPSREGERGTYYVEGATVEMEFTTSTGGTTRCIGRIRDDVLSVSGDYAGKYHFIAPPARTDGLRLDGVYTNESFWMDEVHPDRAGWDRHTFKFKSDGTVSYDYAGTWGSEVPKLTQPGEDDTQGTYKVEGTSVELTFMGDDDTTRNWYGTIDGESFTLSMGSGIKQYIFVSDQDIT